MRLGLEPPIVNCSGILSYVDVFELWEEKGAAIGGWITKSYGLEKRDGNENPTVYEFERGVMNSMGLSNPGAKDKRALDELKNAKLRNPLIVSVMGFEPAEYGQVVRIMEEEVGGKIVAYVGNKSCPNIVPGETSIAGSIGDSPELVREAVEGMRAFTKKPIITKISPKCDVKRIAKAAEDAGADYIGCANTMPGLVFDKNRRPVLTGGSGGISGPALKPINLKVVYDVYEAIDPKRTGIIAYGGIECVDDILDYCTAGAELFGLGSVFRYKNTEQAVGRTKEIARGLKLRLSTMNTSLEELRGVAHG